MTCTFQDLEVNDYKTVLNIKESKYGAWSQKTYKKLMLNRFKVKYKKYLLSSYD